MGMDEKKAKKIRLNPVRRGMSFVEVIIAIFIFSVVMFAVMTIFTSSFGGYKKADNMAKNIENAQFAMNSMAKSLRTSKVISIASSSAVTAYDFSENTCKRYTFNGSQILAASYGATFANDPDCILGTFSQATPISAQYVQGSFLGSASVPPVPDVSAGTMGKVTIRMKVCSDPGCAAGGKNDSVTIQTTVSLRDYSTVGL